MPRAEDGTKPGDTGTLARDKGSIGSLVFAWIIRRQNCSWRLARDRQHSRAVTPLLPRTAVVELELARYK